MTQRAALQALDADMFAAFASVGMADTATYQAPDGVAVVPCTALVDQPEIVRDGADGPTLGTRTEITLQRSEVGNPQRRGRVVIEGTAYLLDNPVFEDASLSRWTVTRDRP